MTQSRSQNTRLNIEIEELGDGHREVTRIAMHWRPCGRRIACSLCGLAVTGKLAHRDQQCRVGNGSCELCLPWLSFRSRRGAFFLHDLIKQRVPERSSQVSFLGRGAGGASALSLP